MNRWPRALLTALALLSCGALASAATTVKLPPPDLTGLIPLAARSGRVLNVPDVTSEPDYVVGWNEARSELVVPLVLVYVC